MRISLVAGAIFLLAAACQQGKSKLDDMPASKPTTASSPAGSGSGARPGPAAPAEPGEDIDSKDILARTETSPNVYVKHVLIGWKGTNPKAKDRTNADAVQLA